MVVPRVLVLNGPNLNLLGLREPGIYGGKSLPDIEADCREHCRKVGLDIDFRQTNHEGVLVDWLQELAGDKDGAVLNAGAYTHTSVAIHDAIRAVAKPVIEVHISNVHARETFRHHSYISGASAGVLAGFGPFGYIMALDAMAHILLTGTKTASA